MLLTIQICKKSRIFDFFKWYLYFLAISYFGGLKKGVKITRRQYLCGSAFFLLMWEKK